MAYLTTACNDASIFFAAFGLIEPENAVKTTYISFVREPVGEYPQVSVFKILCTCILILSKLLGLINLSDCLLPVGLLHATLAHDADDLLAVESGYTFTT